MRSRILPLIYAAPLLLAGCCSDICCDTCVPPDPCAPCKPAHVAPAPAAPSAPAAPPATPDAAPAK
jgi:hypothetical protein